MDLDFWRNKNVLITGHTGFKGSWLSLWLHQLGANVSGYSLEPPTEPSIFEVAKVSSILDHDIRHDIRDLNNLTAEINRIQPEIVIHMAAQSLVRTSYSEPVETYSVNVMGTVNLLEAINQSSFVKVILNITTDKCYENIERSQGYTESDPMGGHDPYSSSKACSELVSAAYRDSFLKDKGIALATARAGNVIGGGDWAIDRIVPDIMRACISNTSLTTRNPNSTRPWQHVLEPLWGYIKLSQRLYEQPDNYSEAWNFGPDEDDVKPVSRVIELMLEHWGIENDWQLDTDNQYHEAKLLQLDCTKSNQKLEWQPIWNLSKALEETVSWYKNWHEGEDMLKFTLQQISTYSQQVSHQNY